MSDIVSLYSPAKLNLYLRVCSKREDGYYNIETIFQKINLCDRITIRLTPRDGIKIKVDNPLVPVDKKNIAFRAADIFFKKFKIKCGVEIWINKNIPISAGLGGGSSNAASVLLGLNQLCGINISLRELSLFGRRLGADVPFFIYPYRFALGLGKGDIISPIETDMRFWNIVVYPGFEVKTSSVYSCVSFNLTQDTLDVKIPIRNLKKGDIYGLSYSLFNDLERISFRHFNILFNIKSALLRNGAYGALMSGSGSGVFGIISTKKEVIHLSKRLKRIFNRRWNIFLASTYISSGVLDG